MHKIKGVFSAALTPINQDYSINSQLFLSHCKWLLTQGLDGLGVFGHNGERLMHLMLKEKNLMTFTNFFN